MIKYLDKQGCETLVSHIKELIATGGTGEAALPDPRALKALIAECTTIHDEAYTENADPTFHTWKSTTEAIQALQAAIDKAQGVVDGYGETVFKQSELDAAQKELQAALETFKSASTETLPDLAEFEALKARVKAVDDTAHVSTDGKDVPFGETWVTAEEKATAATAVQTAESAIEAATKQPEVDTACDKLETAVTVYESSVATAVADTAALDAAIKAAQEARNGVVVSADGSELEPGSSYVTEQQTLDDIDTALSEAISDKSSATTQKMLDDAKAALNEALETFKSKLKMNVTVYGVDFADFPTSTKGTRTDASAEFGDPTPALNNGDGSSPFDDIAPWSGMKRATRTGGEMVEIPKFWYKLTQSGNGVKIQIATGQMEGFSVSPAHMDRGDGKGERDVVYVGRYHCDSAYKSTTKVNLIGNITHSVARTGCQSVGAGYYMMDFATRFTLWLLYLVEFADWNSQSTIGYGTGNDSTVQAMGYTDNMKYHTGTTQAARTTQAIGCQYRYIEGPWDNCYDWLDGIYYASDGIHTTVNPSEFADNSSGVLAGASPADGFPSKLSVSETGQFPMFYSTESKGSATAGTCDYWGFGAPDPCVVCGGGFVHSDSYGMFGMTYYSMSHSSEFVGVRLMELP